VPTIAEALTAARRKLPAAESRLLLGEVLQQSAAWLLTHDDAELSEDHLACFASWVARRAGGEPVAYLIGHREFFGRKFCVAPGVLIPRPETELLVDIAKTKVSRGGTAQILDLGTGSGCIAISVALECPSARVTAVDFSREALAIAERNRHALHAANLQLIESNWFAALSSQRFDLILSNPPYIADADPHLQQGDLTSEPVSALASGSDGLDDIRRIITDAPNFLTSSGELWLEHGYDQALAVRQLLLQRGFVEVTSGSDLAGIERVSGGRFPKN
jgi:release factor glutamine methyltransferase